MQNITPSALFTCIRDSNWAQQRGTWTRGARNPMFLAAGRAFLLWSHTQKNRLVYCIGQLNQDQETRSTIFWANPRNPSLPIGWWSRVTLAPFCIRSKHALCLAASFCRDLLVYFLALTLAIVRIKSQMFACQHGQQNTVPYH